MNNSARPASWLHASLLSACIVWAAVPAAAQTSAAPGPSAPAHSAACAIDHPQPSEADLAFAKGNYKQAEALYRALMAKNEGDGRSHSFAIQSVLGQNKLTDAQKQADEWTAQSPKSAFAILTAGNVRFAEGDWVESYALVLRALKLDPCSAEAYDGMGQYEQMAGFRATARKHLTLAHQLAPNDLSIRLDWIDTLNPAEQPVELRKYLEESKTVDPKKLASFEQRVDTMAALRENHCDLVSADGPARIPMVPIYDGLSIASYGLEIAFNGHKRTLQIDTGATGLLLTRAGATGAGLSKVDTARVGGFGNDGANGVLLSRADSVRVGNLEFKGCTVDSLVNPGVMGGSTMMGERLDRTDGLVGMDLFARYLVTLDYLKHEVRLDPLPQPPSAAASNLDPLGGSTDPNWINVDRFVAPSMASWTKIYRRDHMLMVPTRVSTDGKAGAPHSFIADTGAEFNMIDVNTAKEFGQAQENTIKRVQGLSGMVNTVYETGKLTLDFAGLRLPVTGMDAIDLSRFSGVTGFLGYPTLQQLVMHIDYRDNLVLFEAPNARH